MVHLFRALGALLALDVDSGAVHMLDELAFDALSALANGTPDEAEAALLAKYDAQDVREVLDELRALAERGDLETSHDYDGLHMEGDGDLKAMCLHAAHDCNLRCKYCFAGEGDYCGPRGLLPLDTGKHALDFLIEHSGARKLLEVDFFGGEPLLNFDVVKQLVAYGRERAAERGKQFKFTMTTNCVGLTDEVIEYLNREMANVVLSIDGRRDIHDAMRPTPNGKGSYDMVLPRALKLARARNQRDYYVRGTFTARNLDFSSDVLALHDAGFEQISVEPVVLPEDSPLALNAGMLPRILHEYDVLAQAFAQRRRQGRGFTFFHFMVDLAGGPCIRKRLTGCGAGNEYIAVTPEGDIYPCHQFVGREGFKMGNVADRSFDRDLQRTFARNHVLTKPACRACWAKYFCSGGCAANAHQFSGRIDTPNAMECEMERKRLECAIALYALQQKEDVS